MIAALLPILGSIGKSVASNLFPDPADKLKAQALEQELQKAVLDHAAAIEQAAAANIQAEAEGMTEPEYLEVYGLIKIGLGGYVVGRSAEKIAPSLIGAIKNR